MIDSYTVKIYLIYSQDSKQQYLLDSIIITCTNTRFSESNIVAYAHITWKSAWASITAHPSAIT